MSEQIRKRIEEIKKQNLAYINLPEIAFLCDSLTTAIKALEKYKNMIPSNRLISAESADYEKLYGIGRIANEALTKISKGAGNEKILV